MGNTTKIEWTDHTFNPWWGCFRVSPACRFCYADTTASRWGHDLWHHSGPRRMMTDTYWRGPEKWNRAAEAAGRLEMVFCASMADVFEIHPKPEINAQLDAARARLWSLVDRTPWLIWQFCTKRPENVAALAPWTDTWPDTVWLGTSVEDNQRAHERIPALRGSNAKITFLSCEPLLEDLDLSPWFQPGQCQATDRIDWVIAGGESGPKARPMHPDWPRSLRDQCGKRAFLFKQWGQFAPESAHAWLDKNGAPRGGLAILDPTGQRWTHTALLAPPSAVRMRSVGKQRAGRVLDGRTWDEFPRPIDGRPLSRPITVPTTRAALASNPVQ